jgi:hypothetical protein
MKYHTLQKLMQAQDAAYDTQVPAALIRAVNDNAESLSTVFGVSARKQLDDFRDMRATRIVFSSLAVAAGKGEMTRRFPKFMAGPAFLRSPEAVEKKNLRDIFPALRYGELLEVKQVLRGSGVHFDGFTVKKFTPGKPAV